MNRDTQTVLLPPVIFLNPIELLILYPEAKWLNHAVIPPLVSREVYLFYVLSNSIQGFPFPCIYPSLLISTLLWVKDAVDSLMVSASWSLTVGVCLCIWFWRQLLTLPV